MKWSRGDSNPRAGVDNDGAGGQLHEPPVARAAISGASGDDSAPLDPDLALVIERWPDLSEAVRTALLALVQATG